MVARFLLDLREMNSGKVVVDNTIATSVSHSNTMPFEAAVNPAFSASSDLPTKPRRRGRRPFDNTSLFKDFADQEVYTDPSSTGTSEFVMKNFSRKGNRKDPSQQQLTSVSGPLEDLIVRARAVEEVLNSNEEISTHIRMQ